MTATKPFEIAESDPDHTCGAYKLSFDDHGTKRRGLFKPRTGEEQGLRPNIETGTFADREVAASRVAEMVGYDRVPLTRMRFDPRPGHAGETGSVQAFAEGATDSKRLPYWGLYDTTWGRVPALEGEKFRLFDYFTGGTDRHLGNVMWQIDANSGVTMPVLIDNGLAFPNLSLAQHSHDFDMQDPGIFNPNMINGSASVDKHYGPISQAAKDWLARFDPEQVASVLHENRIQPDAIEFTLRRLEKVKRDSSFLEGSPSNNPYSGIPDRTQFQTPGTYWRAFSDKTQGLEDSKLKEIHELVQRVKKTIKRRSESGGI